MFHNILSNRGLLAGLVFFAVIVVGSLLYSWHVKRKVDEDIARTQRIMQLRESNRTVSAVQDVGAPTDPETLGVWEIPPEIDDMQAMSSEDKEALPSDDAALVDLADAFLPDETTEEETAEVPVSPYGFGPYPEVPSDYFGEPIWIRDPGLFSDFPDDARKNIELIDRVLVKLWQQGDREIVGGSTYNGKVYPHYDNVVYVRWEEVELPGGGVHRYVSRLKGAGEGPTPHDISTGNIPPNFKVVELDDAGFDPYQFLNFKYEE